MVKKFIKESNWSKSWKYATKYWKFIWKLWKYFFKFDNNLFATKTLRDKKSTLTCKFKIFQSTPDNNLLLKFSLLYFICWFNAHSSDNKKWINNGNDTDIDASDLHGSKIDSPHTYPYTIKIKLMEISRQSDYLICSAIFHTTFIPFRHVDGVALVLVYSLKFWYFWIFRFRVM